jgi:hypothetical protein
MTIAIYSFLVSAGHTRQPVTKGDGVDRSGTLLSLLSFLDQTDCSPCLVKIEPDERWLSRPSLNPHPLKPLNFALTITRLQNRISVVSAGEAASRRV